METGENTTAHKKVADEYTDGELPCAYGNGGLNMGKQLTLIKVRARKVKKNHASSAPGRLVESDQKIQHERGTYFGGAGADGTYQALINLIPPHETFISLFAGKCAVRYHMKESTSSYMFDLDEKMVKWWRTWRKQKPGAGTFDAQRKSAFDVLDEPWLTTATWLDSTFMFLDPPFPPSTRKNSTRNKYLHDLTDEDHVKLCKVLHKDYRDVKILIRSYENDIYDKHLKGWHKTFYMNTTHAGQVQECAYTNYAPPAKLHDYNFLGENFEDRRRIKRKIKRHVDRLRKLKPTERNAIIHAIQLYNKHIFK